VAAQNAYALAYRAVVELASIDPASGLSRFFNAWRETRSMDVSLRSEFGLTLAGYEQRWRQSTRRRYGMLALFSNVALAGAILIVLVFPLYIARRQRDKQRLAAMVAADEAAERAARTSVIEALLRGEDWSDFGEESPPASPPPPPS
jgi:type II secretory pathway component PulM